MNYKPMMTEKGQLFLVNDRHEEVARIIFSYVRDKKNRRVGVVTATQLVDDGPIKFGYAKYNPKKEKGKPNRDFAFQIAIGRMIKRDDIVYPFSENFYPEDVRKPLRHLWERATSYFHMWGEEDFQDNYCTSYREWLPSAKELELE